MARHFGVLLLLNSEFPHMASSLNNSGGGVRWGGDKREEGTLAAPQPPPYPSIYILAVG